MLSYAPLPFGRRQGDAVVEWQTHYRLGDEKISRSLGASVPAVLADLIDIAVAVYVTDRLSPRSRQSDRSYDGTEWARRLQVEVAVRCPETWRSTPVTELLHRLLHWLTDDDWSLILVEGGPELIRPSDSQLTLFEEPLVPPAQAALLSGGLDSLLGAAADLNREGELLLVSTSTSGKLGRWQADIARELGRIGPRPVRFLGVPVNLTQAGKQLTGKTESTQRTRSFVFLVLGAVAAATGGADELRVYENGIGALNLAQSPGQRGAMTTRAMRPETLAFVAQLMSELTGKPFRVVNPNRWSTKAEMVRAASRDIDRLFAVARSCDTAHSGRRKNDAPCGKCTSCVLRHQALLAGGRPDINAGDMSLIGGDSFRANAPGVLDEALSLMLRQVYAFRECLSAPDQWRALVERWPDLISARRALTASPGQLVDLVDRYVAEWEHVDAPAVRRVLAV